MLSVYKSKFLWYIVCVLCDLHVWTFYLNLAIFTQKQQIQCNDLPPPPYIVLFFLFMSWKNVLICFRRFGLGGQDLQKVREPKDWLPEAWTPEG